MKKESYLEVETICKGVCVPNRVVIPLSLKSLFDSDCTAEDMLQLVYNVAVATVACATASSPSTKVHTSVAYRRCLYEV